jgi:PAS domain-containing protein
VDRNEAEDALRASEELLEAARNPSRIGAWEWDVAKREMLWTDELYRIHGMEPGEADHHRRGLACYGEADRAKILSALERCCETGAPYALELDLTDRTGRPMRVRIAAQAVRQQSAVTRVLGTVVDITPSGS